VEHGGGWGRDARTERVKNRRVDELDKCLMEPLQL
jgi:hypothetical protein